VWLVIKLKLSKTNYVKLFVFLHKDVDNCVSLDMFKRWYITNTVYLITFDDNEKFIIDYKKVR
jgi:hypothetical protein